MKLIFTNIEQLEVSMSAVGFCKRVKPCKFGADTRRILHGQALTFFDLGTAPNWGPYWGVYAFFEPPLYAPLVEARTQQGEELTSIRSTVNSFHTKCSSIWEVQPPTSSCVILEGRGKACKSWVRQDVNQRQIPQLQMCICGPNALLQNLQGSKRTLWITVNHVP